MKEDLFVPTAEAAFIAGITDREMNRAVDEHIPREPLIRSANGRLFARLGAALASFYFKTEQIYVASFRRRVLEEVMLRIQRSAVDHVDMEAICALRETPKEGWRIRVEPDVDTTGVIQVDVDLDRFVVDASRRMKEIERVEDLIRSDSEIMGGAPVFAGTRVPIDSVVASLEKGIDPKRILQAYRL